MSEDELKAIEEARELLTGCTGLSHEDTDAIDSAYAAMGRLLAEVRRLREAESQRDHLAEMLTDCEILWRDPAGVLRREGSGDEVFPAPPPAPAATDGKGVGKMREHTDDTEAWCAETEEEGLEQACGGTRVLHCFCGGDQCYCGNNGEVECYGCEDCDEHGGDDLLEDDDEY